MKIGVLIFVLCFVVAGWVRFFFLETREPVKQFEAVKQNDNPQRIFSKINKPQIKQKISKKVSADEEGLLFVFNEDLEESIKQDVTQICEDSYEFIFENFDFLKKPQKAIRIFIDGIGSSKTVLEKYPSWSSSYFDGDVHLLLDLKKTDLAQKMRHELVHAILYQLSMGKKIPRWFEEGFAQLVACEGVATCFKEDTLAVDKRVVFSVQDFEREFAELGSPEAKTAYKQSYELTKYLLAHLSFEEKNNLFDWIGASNALSSDELVRVAKGEENGFAKLLEEFRLKR